LCVRGTAHDSTFDSCESDLIEYICTVGLCLHRKMS